jgi:hypothetical protein
MLENTPYLMNLLHFIASKIKLKTKRVSNFRLGKKISLPQTSLEKSKKSHGKSSQIGKVLSSTMWNFLMKKE